MIIEKLAVVKYCNLLLIKIYVLLYENVNVITKMLNFSYLMMLKFFKSFLQKPKLIKLFYCILKNNDVKFSSCKPVHDLLVITQI